MKSTILVEGSDDKAFIEALLKGANIITAETKDMGGLNLSKLKKALAEVKNRIIKTGNSKIGIIIDRDDYSEQERVAFINQALEGIFDVRIVQPGTPVNFLFETLPMEISCYIISAGTTGELEGYLMQMAASPAHYANCLKQWRHCLEMNQVAVSDKEFRKFWVHYYTRFDTSNAEERSHGNKYCSTEYSITSKPQHWNFNIPELEGLKNYLTLFN
jgi:hypothetical protein